MFATGTREVGSACSSDGHGQSSATYAGGAWIEWERRSPLAQAVSICERLSKVEAKAKQTNIKAMLIGSRLITAQAIGFRDTELPGNFTATCTTFEASVQFVVYSVPDDHTTRRPPLPVLKSCSCALEV